MDIGKLTGKIPKWLHTYRYPILILIVGVVLLTLPTEKKSQTEQIVTTISDNKTQTDISEQLAQILAQMDGVGKVKVMLTLSVGETTVYHSDENIDTADGTSSIRKETVIITDSDRNEKPLITQVIPEKYQGAVIVCQGADSPSVKWAIVEAVSKATGLGADQISVLKMK